MQRNAKDSFCRSTLPGTNTFLDAFFSPSLKITSKLLLVVLLNVLMGHPHQYQAQEKGKGGSEATWTQHPDLGSPWPLLGPCLVNAACPREQQPPLVCVIDKDLNLLVFRVCLAARADPY